MSGRPELTPEQQATLNERLLHLVSRTEAPMIEDVQALLDQGADVKAANETTPLHWAADRGHTEIAALLLEVGADVKAANNYGDTPLHWAARYGHSEIAALLLEAGANVNAANRPRYTPLDEASIEGHTKIAALINQHIRLLEIEARHVLTPEEAANPALVFLHGVGTGNITLLQNVLTYPELVKDDKGYVDPASTEQAAYSQALIEEFIAAKAANNKKAILSHKFTCGRTALHVLAQHPIEEAPGQDGVADIATLLVKSISGIDPNKKDAKGMTAFQTALIAKNVGLLEHLIHLGANPHETFKHEGELITPLEYLIKTENTKSFEILANILDDNDKLGKAVAISGDKLIEFASKNGLECCARLTKIKAKIDSAEEGAALLEAAIAEADIAAGATEAPALGGGASTVYPDGYPEGHPALAGATDAAAAEGDFA